MPPFPFGLFIVIALALPLLLVVVMVVGVLGARIALCGVWGVGRREAAEMSPLDVVLRLLAPPVIAPVGEAPFLGCGLGVACEALVVVGSFLTALLLLVVVAVLVLLTGSLMSVLLALVPLLAVVPKEDTLLLLLAVSRDTSCLTRVLPKGKPLPLPLPRGPLLGNGAAVPTGREPLAISPSASSIVKLKEPRREDRPEVAPAASCSRVCMSRLDRSNEKRRLPPLPAAPAGTAPSTFKKSSKPSSRAIFPMRGSGEGMHGKISRVKLQMCGFLGFVPPLSGAPFVQPSPSRHLSADYHG